MTTKHFDAIVAKNNLARVVRGIMRKEYAEMSELPWGQMLYDLQEIEHYLGVGNQPEVTDIVDSDIEI